MFPRFKEHRVIWCRGVAVEKGKRLKAEGEMSNDKVRREKVEVEAKIKAK